jgi:hypothetical protein
MARLVFTLRITLYAFGRPCLLGLLHFVELESEDDSIVRFTDAASGILTDHIHAEFIRLLAHGQCKVFGRTYVFTNAHGSNATPIVAEV